MVTIEASAVSMRRRMITVKTLVEPLRLTLNIDEAIPVLYSPSASVIV